ncbi:hypothetical protein D3C81_1546970 [compost metagenome]
MLQILGLEQGVCRQWADQSDTFSTQLVERRDDGIYLFTSHMAAFPGMRVQATDVDLRLGEAKFGFQVVVENADDFMQALPGDSARHRQ